MGYEMLAGPDGAETMALYFGSTDDVTALMDWIAGLPEGEYPLVRAFARDFETDRPESFSAQMAEARDAHPPDEVVAGLVQELGSTAEGVPDGTPFRLAS